MPYRDAEQKRAYNRAYLKRWREQNPDYMKRWRQRNPGRIRVYDQKREQDPHYRAKRRAYDMVKYHLKLGSLHRPTECEQCGSVCKPDAAHADYSKELAVRWLCRPCHRRWDIDFPKT